MIMFQSKCKNCGGKVTARYKEGVFSCENCGTFVSIYDIESVESCFFELESITDNELKVYQKARALFERAACVEEIDSCIKLLSSLNHVLDSEGMLRECKQRKLAMEEYATKVKAIEYSQSNEEYIIDRAIAIFENHPHWEESGAKIQECRAKKLQIAKSYAEIKQNEIRTERRNKIVKFLRTFIIIVLVAAVLGGIYFYSKEKHNVEKIEIELLDIKKSYNPDESPYINGCYYLYFEFQITNNCITEIKSIETTTYIKDADGKLLQQINSSFGGYNDGIYLEKGENLTIETYLKENRPEQNQGFADVYNSEFSDLDIIIVVTSVEFTDGHKYKK